MISVKEQAKLVIDDMPEDVSIDEIIQELAFRIMIDKGLEDSDHNRIISDDQLEQEIEQW
jgi:hypothetical protein